MPLTLSEARATVRRCPGKYRAAVVWAPAPPILDHPQARATLHEKVGTAQAEYRTRKESLVKSGWKLTYGGLGKSVMRFERDGETRYLGLDKRRPQARAGKAHGPGKSEGVQLAVGVGGNS